MMKKIAYSFLFCVPFFFLAGSVGESFIKEQPLVKKSFRHDSLKACKQELLEKELGMVPLLAETIEKLAQLQKKICSCVEKSLVHDIKQEKLTIKNRIDELNNLTLSLQNVEQQCKIVLKGL